MSVKFASFSCTAASLSSPSGTRRSLLLSFPQGSCGTQQYNFQRIRYAKGIFFLYFLLFWPFGCFYLYKMAVNWEIWPLFSRPLLFTVAVTLLVTWQGSYIRLISQNSSIEFDVFLDHIFLNLLLVLRIVESFKLMHGMLKSWRRFPRRHIVISAILENQSQFTESVDSEQENEHPTDEDISPESNSFLHYEGTGGKPGLISFYKHSYKEGNRIPSSSPQSNQYKFLWLIAPAVLVASFIFPSLYLRKILSTIFEDSLLTDFLILFFTEAVFYCGVAVFLFLIDLSRRATDAVTNEYETLSNHLGQRISSVAAFVLSLIIPMVTMGLVWPWTGPAASATLAPYLVGIIVQFAFEQYARSKKSPSWPVIPIIFQVYRLHQLNRATQLVAALSFTIKGAEMTPHNLAINSSLGTLLKVLQSLGIICIWSLSSFLMTFFPSNSTSLQ